MNQGSSDDPVNSAEEGSSSKLFDLRSLIAVVLGVYGLLLMAIGFFDTADSLRKASGLPVNMDFGIILVLTSIFFIVWRIVAPIRH